MPELTPELYRQMSALLRERVEPDTEAFYALQGLANDLAGVLAKRDPAFDRIAFLSDAGLAPRFALKRTRRLPGSLIDTMQTGLSLSDVLDAIRQTQPDPNYVYYFQEQAIPTGATD